MSSTKLSALQPHDLAQFTGSQTFFHHALSGGCVYSEGVRYLAETAAAYWLLDAILCPQPHHHVLRTAAFQVWTLTVREDRLASLICTDGDGQDLYVHVIPWTDFPIAAVTLWFADGTLYLPSEH